MIHHALLALHLLAVAAWLGGMSFAHFCLRPAAAQLLEPPMRLPLMLTALGRFLHYMALAVPLTLITGLAMLLPVGFRQAPLGWHLMLGIGLVMAGVYACIHLALLPRLRRHCAASAWPLAAQALNAIRRLVVLNLALGVLAILAAVSAR